MAKNRFVISKANDLPKNADFGTVPNHHMTIWRHASENCQHQLAQETLQIHAFGDSGNTGPTKGPILVSCNCKNMAHSWCHQQFLGFGLKCCFHIGGPFDACYSWYEDADELRALRERSFEQQVEAVRLSISLPKRSTARTAS